MTDSTRPVSPPEPPPEARLRAALAALHPSSRYVRVEAIDLAAYLDAARAQVETGLDVERLAEAMWFEGLVDGPAPNRHDAERLMAAYRGMVKHHAALGSPTPTAED